MQFSSNLPSFLQELAHIKKTKIVWSLTWCFLHDQAFFRMTCHIYFVGHLFNRYTKNALSFQYILVSSWFSNVLWPSQQLLGFSAQQLHFVEESVWQSEFLLNSLSIRKFIEFVRMKLSSILCLENLDAFIELFLYCCFKIFKFTKGIRLHLNEIKLHLWREVINKQQEMPSTKDWKYSHWTTDITMDKFKYLAL